MAASPSTAKKPARNRPALRVVRAETALESASKAIADAALQVAPMTSRAIAVRNENQLRANGLIREREDYEDRKSLLTAQYEAAMKGLDENIADIDAALVLTNTGAGEQQAAE
jgi:hypothetical protein